jgi:hypothetical protein
MNTNKLIMLLLAGPVSLILLLTVVRQILHKLKANSEDDFRLKPAYGLYFSGLLLAGILLQVTAVNYIAEAADNIQKMGTVQPFFEMGKIAVLFSGLGIVWFFLCFLLSGAFAAVVLGVKKEAEEMLLGNTYYFLVKSLLLLGLVLVLSPAFTLTLRWLMPGISVGFIR